MTPVSINGEDAGPPRRRTTPAFSLKGNARKRRSAIYHLRPLPNKCKSFALSVVRTVRHSSPRAEELVERLEANTQLGPKPPGHHTYALQFEQVANLIAKPLEATKAGLGAFRGDPEKEKGWHDIGGAQPIDISPPWDAKVDAKEVLDLICAAIDRFVWVKRSQWRAMALWIVLSYLHDVVDILPLLLITSPEGFGRYLLESVGHIIQKRKKENLEPTEKIFFQSSDLRNELNQDWKHKQDGIDALVAFQRLTARYCARHQILTTQ